MPRATCRRGRIPDVAGESALTRHPPGHPSAGHQACPGESGQARPGSTRRPVQAGQCGQASAGRPVRAGQCGQASAGRPVRRQSAPGPARPPGRAARPGGAHRAAPATEERQEVRAPARQATGPGDARAGHQASASPGHNPARAPAPVAGPDHRQGRPPRAPGQGNGRQGPAARARPPPGPAPDRRGQQDRPRTTREKAAATQDVSRRLAYPLALLPGVQQEL